MAQGVGGFGGTYGSHFQLVLESHEIQLDTPNNRSLIEITLYMVDVSGAGSDYYNYDSCPWSIGGTVGLSGGITYNLNGNGQVVYMVNNNQYWVGHNGDGTGSVSLSASFNANDSPYLTSASTSLSYGLTTIKRWANVTYFDVVGQTTNTGFTLLGYADEACGEMAFSIDGGNTYPQYNFGQSGLEAYFGNLQADTTYVCYMSISDPYSGYWSYAGPLYVQTLPGGGFFMS